MEYSDTCPNSGKPTSGNQPPEPYGKMIEWWSFRITTMYWIVPVRLRGLEAPRLNIRPARVSDVPAICDLIKSFADKKLMIRRTLGELYESIREFYVAVDDDGQIIGCSALHVFWEDLAELKCLAVTEQAQGRGIGRKLVDACWDSARVLDIKSVFTLTYVPEFFERCGYAQIEKSELPHKIWNECVRCPLFPNCNEVALIRSVGVSAGMSFHHQALMPLTVGA